MVVMPAATAAPEPPEEPPQVYRGSQGLRETPHKGLLVMPQCASSGVVVRDNRIAPALNRRSTVGAEFSGLKSA